MDTKKEKVQQIEVFQVQFSVVVPSFSTDISEEACVVKLVFSPSFTAPFPLVNTNAAV